MRSPFTKLYQIYVLNVQQMSQSELSVFHWDDWDNSSHLLQNPGLRLALLFGENVRCIPKCTAMVLLMGLHGIQLTKL
jgi:hypothetical protein